MYPLQSTRYLLQFAYWLQRALCWRQDGRRLGYYNLEHIRNLQSWAKADLAKWRLATFGA